ncbi:uncharacterized protein FOMMEDRAFT_27450 [Fomitiporia mediterranea MF3/22]|uniref:uncharacterized protein n=1 Tax=Fomitiporia mediterranea (strain MF3/22) TaxID=694068 RepID=UPI00044073C1|nr:uncharacterized protein FOMMEDRAFT_27450 [Fomitiporia mediterranea MF3/22]EJD05289.1 hypothetical protein FOMMEDRAFT_27450 [Fomitiporia mediterranea MF3/22]
MSEANSTATDTGALVIPALDDTLGALYIGILLWGVASLQLFYYFTRFPRDSWSTKVLVLVVWGLDTIHQGMISHAGYIYTIKQYGNISFVSHVELTLELMILISGINCLIVQIFLVNRVWKLSQGNKWLVIYLMITVLAAFSFITSYFAKSIEGSTFSNVKSREWLGRASESLVVISDFSIAGSLIYYLQRSRTGFRKTETMVNRLTILTVNTGLSTSIVATLTLIFLSAYPHKYIYTACFVNISKLYTNAFLATLNSRRSFQEDESERTEELQSIALSKLRNIVRGRGTRDDLEGRAHVLSIQVQTDTTFSRENTTGKDSKPDILDITPEVAEKGTSKVDV